MLSPDDEALLNDLLDDRMGAAEEAALSARMEREPALREAWDELVRAREFLRDAPDPVPPSDFTARVRARLAATHQGADGEPLPGETTGVPATAIPLFWRRMMTVAYAAAAALILGIGALALRDRTAGAPATHGETSLARTEREKKSAEGFAPSDKELDAKEGTSAEAASLDLGMRADRATDRDAEAKDPGNAVPPPRDPLGEASELGLPSREQLEAERKPTPKTERPEAGAAAPSGPGGQVPPSLRQPSDAPTRPPAAPVEAPSAPPPPAPAPGSRAVSPPSHPPAAPGGAAPVAPPSAPGAPGEPQTDPALGELLVLEAATFEAGRTLLDSVVAGPGARARDASGGASGGAGAQGTSAPSTRVSLRRVDLARDAVLLAAMKTVTVGTAAAAKGKRVPPEAAPKAPAAPPTTPPTTTPPTMPPTTPAPYGAPQSSAPAPAPSAAPPAERSAPGARPTGGGAGVPGTLLGVEPRTLSAEEYARLVALLGPSDGLARDGKSVKKDEPGHRIRVLIVTPTR